MPSGVYTGDRANLHELQENVKQTNEYLIERGAQVHQFGQVSMRRQV